MEDALLLARAQFGLNIGFHILFPTLTIALAWFLLGFRILYQRTRDPAWLATYKLWLKIFALTFAMGVVSGVTMSGMPPTRVATTGRPVAIASSIVFERPSINEGRTNRSKPRSRSGISSRTPASHAS